MLFSDQAEPEITSIPTLLAFSRQEPQLETRCTKLEQMRDIAQLRRWIEAEAQRGAQGGRGGQSWLGNVLGLGTRS